MKQLLAVFGVLLGMLVETEGIFGLCGVVSRINFGKCDRASECCSPNGLCGVTIVSSSKGLQSLTRNTPIHNAGLLRYWMPSTIRRQLQSSSKFDEVSFLVLVDDVFCISACVCLAVIV